MPAKKNADERTKHVMISLRPDTLRAAEYLSLTYRGGLSSWIQDQLAKIDINVKELNAERQRKYPNYMLDVCQELQHKLGENAKISFSNDPRFDFVTPDGILVAAHFVNDKPVFTYRRDNFPNEISVKDEISKLQKIK